MNSIQGSTVSFGRLRWLKNFHRTPRSLFLMFAALLGAGNSVLAQTSYLDVTNFGARGDAASLVVSTLKNSNIITVQSTNRFSAGDIGKTILLFGVGAPTSTTNQDVVAQISGVVSGTSITISTPAGCTKSGVTGTYGTQNAGPFQSCVDACVGTNTIVHIPAGCYLLVSPAMFDSLLTMPNETYVWPAVTLRKGGIQFVGDGADSTILMGCGAWLKKGNYVQRGYMFFCQGPVTNNYPLVFNQLTFDGGVSRGSIANKDFPANPNDGTGWDETHGAILDIGLPPLHAYKAFQNCKITHWRGEMFKSVAPNADGFIDISNCVFFDGNASAVNFSFSHHINACLFSNVKMATEFYAGYSCNTSTFENSIITNAQGGLVLTGALVEHTMPSYIVRSNQISADQFNVLLGPSRNVTIQGNLMSNSRSGIQTSGYAYQGDDCNGNILVEGNTFTNVFQPFFNGGDHADRMENVLIRSNLAYSCESFANGCGWGTNVSFIGNICRYGLLNSSTMTGQWLLDDDSNQFPYQYITGTANISNNIITYAKGMRQALATTLSNAQFAIDDIHPRQTPAGAHMNIQNTATLPVSVYVSVSLSQAPVVLQPGSGITCMWTGSGWAVQLPPVGNVQIR